MTTTNMMLRGADQLEKRRGDFAAVPVSYQRVRPSDPGDGALTLPIGVTISTPDSNGNVTVAKAINATIGKTPFKQENQSGVTITEGVEDWLALMTDLADFWEIAGGKEQPDRGDAIIYNDQTFSLMPFEGQPVFSSSGGYGKTWRIHSKRTG